MRNEKQPAYQLLCDLLANRSQEEDWAALSPAGWELLAKVAVTEGVAPLAYWHYGQCGWPGSMPESVHDTLRYAYAATYIQNKSLYQELDRILDALAEAGVPVIVLKGADLAVSLYPDIGLRPMCDLDLLVTEQQLEKAVRSVQSLGYGQVIPELAPGFNRAIGHHVYLQGSRQPGVAVELHWNLIAGDADYRSPPLEWFWQQTKAFTLNSEHRPGPNEALKLTPTAHLLYLTAHLMLQHGGAQARLLWLYDLHLLLLRDENRIRWDEFLKRSRQFHWAPAARAALAAVHAELNTPLPPGLLQALAEIPDPQASNLVSRKRAPQTTTARAWDLLGSLDWRARLLFVRGMLFPRPAYLRRRYTIRPVWLWPLYYPYRWLDMLRDGFRTVVRPG